MKYDSDKTPIILGINLILAVLVGLSLIITDFFNDLALESDEKQGNLYSRDQDSDSQEDVVELVTPSQNPQGTGVPIESDGSLEINSYTDASAPNGASYSLTTDSSSDRSENPRGNNPPNVFDRPDNRVPSLSSQSLTGNNHSSSTGTSSESLLNSVEDDNPLGSLDSNSNSFRSRDDSRKIDALENSRF